MIKRFLCRQCKLVFDLENLTATEKGEECPGCRSTDVVEAPTWAPLNSGSNIFEGDAWEYECHNCRNKFKLPIPKSPAENRSRKCPTCKSDHLHLLTNKDVEPLYCG